jgi:DNA-binding Lrp family transcriptional regulator
MPTKGSDLRLLTALSMNARISIAKAARISGIDKQTAYNRIGNLEKQLGLKYILELDLSSLGYIPYLLLIRFEGKAPSQTEIESAFVRNPMVQFAARTKGEYDIVAYLLDTTDTVKVIEDFRSLMINTELGKHGMLWNLVPIGMTYSFVPLRNEFIDATLKTIEKARKRSYKSGGILMRREFAILKELNANSTASFSEIDRKYALASGSARYAYHDLKSRGVIVRPTIAIPDLQSQYIGMLHIANIYEKQVEENRYKFLMDIIEQGQIANKYLLTGNIGAPEGTVLFQQLTSDKGIDDVAERITKELEGSTVTSTVITKIMVGSLCSRRFDNDHSRQHRLLVESGKLRPKELANYE